MQEEISHCGAGVRWLSYLFDQAAQQDPPVEPSELELQPQSFPDVESWFHALVRRHFKGDLKVCACHVIWQFTLCLRPHSCRIRLSEPDAREVTSHNDYAVCAAPLQRGGKGGCRIHRSVVAAADGAAW